VNKIKARMEREGGKLCQEEIGYCDYQFRTGSIEVVLSILTHAYRFNVWRNGRVAYRTSDISLALDFVYGM